MANEPFAPDDVLYRFTPTEEERAYFGYHALVELVVVKAYPFVDWNNLLLFARFSYGVSQLGPLESGVLSVLFGHLLRDLTTERNGWGDTAQMFEQQRDEARAALACVEAERDAYQDVLERYAMAPRGNYARVVLEQRKKLKEEKGV